MDRCHAVEVAFTPAERRAFDELARALHLTVSDMIREQLYLAPLEGGAPSGDEWLAHIGLERLASLDA